MDPLQAKFPSFSPYNTFVNNPIHFIDPDGQEIVVPANLKGSQRRAIMRNLRRLTDDKLSYDKTTGVVTVSKHRIGRHPRGTELLNRVIESPRVMTIGAPLPNTTGNSEVDDNSRNAINGVGSDVTVRFDPTSNPDIMTANPRTGNVSGKKRPNKIGLAHEIIHGERSMRGGAINYEDMGTYMYSDANGTMTTQAFPKEELATVGLKYNTARDITENDIRREQRWTRKKRRGAY